eukprot:9477133-Pyramimonas_sp.AAC.1
MPALKVNNGIGLQPSDARQRQADQRSGDAKHGGAVTVPDAVAERYSIDVVRSCRGRHLYTESNGARRTWMGIVRRSWHDTGWVSLSRTRDR